MASNSPSRSGPDLSQGVSNTGNVDPSPKPHTRRSDASWHDLAVLAEKVAIGGKEEDRAIESAAIPLDDPDYKVDVVVSCRPAKFVQRLDRAPPRCSPNSVENLPCLSPTALQSLRRNRDPADRRRQTLQETKRVPRLDELPDLQVHELSLTCASDRKQPGRLGQQPPCSYEHLMPRSFLALLSSWSKL